ncbi:MAG: 50S ribosomal protein L1 [Planctomycetes bacterium]|nr:50S ribosomal protein L1 [Planctomycetota bacterium]
MTYQSVTYRKQLDKRSGSGVLSLEEALAKVKEMADVRSDRKYKNGKKRKGFDQTVEIVMHLGIDPRQADQMLRGAISLPKGLGKSRRVIAFCEESLAEQAKEAGAIEAGAEELIKKVAGGWMDFDVAVAHPSMMGKVGKLGRILGPQGKMPSPKAGTVSPEVASVVKEFVAGRLEFRNDDGGNIHLPVGKVSFSIEDLQANVTAVLDHFTKIKPVAAKGHYFKRVCLSATRTPSVTIEATA